MAVWKVEDGLVVVEWEMELKWHATISLEWPLPIGLQLPTECKCS